MTDGQIAIKRAVIAYFRCKLRRNESFTTKEMKKVIKTFSSVERLSVEERDEILPEVVAELTKTIAADWR